MLRSHVGELCEDQIQLPSNKTTTDVTDGKDMGTTQTSEASLDPNDLHDIIKQTSKQVLLDLSSLNRNVVNMSHRNARKLIRKTVLVSGYED